jgi:rsbT co-antagonist protein RsbR
MSRRRGLTQAAFRSESASFSRARRSARSSSLASSWSPRRFTPYELEIISAIASQGAAVAERLRLLDTSRQQLEELTRLRQALERKVEELSAPIIPLAHDIIVMPLVGSIDQARAEQVMAALLTGVEARRATTAILDVTGIPAMDADAAGALLRAAQAVALIGARAVITGVRPEIARTLVGLGVDLGAVVTRSTVREGVEFAMQSRARRARVSAPGS